MTRLFIHVHGGAYVYGGGDASMGEGIIIAGRLGIPVVSIDYRMPPEHPFPAAVDDVVTVYKHLLTKHSPGSMIIGGTSAGGGLALASVHKFRQMTLPTPGAVYGGTAWADLTKTGDSLYTNEGLDRILVTYDGSLEAAAKLYAAGHDLKDPLISPVYGDFKDFPPTILVTGTRDLFLSDVSRTHRKLRAAGVEADLHVYEGMSHAGYVIVVDSPESVDMFNELGMFVDKHLASD
jgi:monoterpene epsilon-lactone hydrolase